jgi:hypothetical protein
MSAVKHPRMEQAIVSFSRAAFGRPCVSAHRMKNPSGASSRAAETAFFTVFFHPYLPLYNKEAPPMLSFS